MFFNHGKYLGVREWAQGNVTMNVSGKSLTSRILLGRSDCSTYTIHCYTMDEENFLESIFVPHCETRQIGINDANDFQKFEN